MNREGFWYSTHEPALPMPVAGVPWEGQVDFLAALDRVEHQAKAEAYRGMSPCRLCGKLNGSRTYSSRGWEWPEGFAHYVRDHDVRPSAAFLEFVLQGGVADDPSWRVTAGTTLEMLVKELGLFAVNAHGVWFTAQGGKYTVVPKWLWAACERLVKEPIRIGDKHDS